MYNMYQYEFGPFACLAFEDLDLSFNPMVEERVVENPPPIEIELQKS